MFAAARLSYRTIGNANLIQYSFVFMFTPGEQLLQFRLFNKRNDMCSMRPFRVIKNDGLNNHAYGRLICVGGKARELPAGAIVLEF